MSDSQIHIRASKEFREKIMSAAKKEDRTMSDWIRQLIIERFIRDDKK